MNNALHKAFAVLLAVIGLNAKAIEPFTEAFTGSLNGWVLKEENSFAETVSHDEDTALLKMTSGGLPSPQSSTFTTGSSGSSGAFAGNYLLAGINRIGFSFFATDAPPGRLRFYLYSEEQGMNVNFLSVIQSTGTWYHLEAPLTWSASSPWLGPDNEAAFNTLISAVDRIEIEVAKNQTAATERYRIDNVFIENVPEVADIQRDETGSVRVTFGPIAAARSYRIQTTTNLVNELDWLDAGSPVSGTNQFKFIDTEAFDTPFRAYRIREQD